MPRITCPRLARLRLHARSVRWKDCRVPQVAACLGSALTVAQEQVGGISVVGGGVGSKGAVKGFDCQLPHFIRRNQGLQSHLHTAGRQPRRLDSASPLFATLPCWLKFNAGF